MDSASFFFSSRRRHTRCGRDWSSDVCSSDLGAVTAFWPPVGVGIAALVLGGLRLWPAVVIGDLLVGNFSTPLGTVLGQTTGNTLEVLVAAALLLRLASRRADLERVRDVLALVVAAAAGTLVSAAVGVLSLRLGHVIAAHEVATV